MAGSETSRDGHLVRHYDLAVSTTALALAWARQEGAPHGAVVVATREVSPLGRHGRLWTVPPESTFACSVVVRPSLPADEGDAMWLLGALVASEAAEITTDVALRLRWPESVVTVDGEDEAVMVKADVQLGPGIVAAAVLTLRFDLTRIGLHESSRDVLLDALLAALRRRSDDDGGSRALAASYEARCNLIGRRVKLSLLPRGETRGTARAVDRRAQLEISSTTGMVERVPVDAVRSIEVVDSA